MLDAEEKANVIADTLPDTQKHASKGLSWSQVHELKIKNLSNGQVAKILGVSRQAVDYYVRKHGREMKLVEDYRKNKADMLLAKQALLLEALTAEKAEGMSGRDLATTFGIIYDKHRLETGRSTANLLTHTNIVELACQDGWEEE